MALDRVGDMDYEGISENAFVAMSTIRDGGYMTKLLVMELVRVSRWIRSDYGPPRPVFSVSPGESARKPTPLTSAQKCRRWKKRAGYYKPSYRANKQAKDSLNALLVISAGGAPVERVVSHGTL